MQDDKEKKKEEFFKKAKEDKIHFQEHAGSILKSHEIGQNSVAMLIKNSLGAQRAMMKSKLERRKKAHFRRLHPEQFSAEKEPVTSRKRSSGASRDLEDEIMVQNRRNSSSKISKQLILSALTTEEKSPESPTNEGSKSHAACTLDTYFEFL